MQMKNNYEAQRRFWQARFLAMDPGALCRKLPFLEADAQKLSLWHFGRHLAVSREDGSIRSLSDDRDVSMTPFLNVMTLLYYAKPGAALWGEWVPFRELKGASVFDSAYRKTVLEPLAAAFSGQMEELDNAVKRLGGERLAPGKYQLMAFGCMPVRLLMWDGDEDFPAQANLLFDKSATDFIHVESMVTVASELYYQLTQAKEEKL